jgi:hypothetical protein
MQHIPTQYSQKLLSWLINITFFAFGIALDPIDDKIPFEFEILI